MGHVSALDYERILAIVAESSHGTADEPLSSGVLEMIRALVGCDMAAYCDGEPWDRAGRRVWATPASTSWTNEEKAVVERHRFDLPLNPSQATLGRAIRVSDAMSQTQYRNLEIYQFGGRRHGIEYAMDYWMRDEGGRVRGLRFDDSVRDFSDRARDTVEVLGRHLRTVLARHDRGIGPPATALLTARETQIMGLLAVGQTNREIGQALSISPHTVRKHLENAYQRVGVHSRAEAVAWAYRVRTSRVTGSSASRPSWDGTRR